MNTQAESAAGCISALVAVFGILTTACPSADLASGGLVVWACGDSLKVSPQGHWYNPAVPKEHRERNRV